MTWFSRSGATDQGLCCVPALYLCAFLFGCGNSAASTEAAIGGGGMSTGPTAPSLGGVAGTGGAAPVTSGSSGLGMATGGTGESGGANTAGGSSNTAGGTPGIGGDASAGTAGMAQAGAGGSVVDQGDLPATTLHLAGDSTVMYYAPPSAQEGWGQELAQYFIGKVAIDNQALGGASVQTFYDGGRWARIASSLKPGDYVMVDFGINDSGGVAGRSVTPTNFQKLMLQMSTEVKAKQATFIIVTPSALQYWSGGMETNARLAPYVAVENSLGTTNQIPIDDLNTRSLEFLNMIGQMAAMQIYINGDKAHFTKMGATQMAKFVATELRRIGSPLADYLK